MLFVISVLFILMTGYQAYLIKKYKRLNKDEMSYVAALTHDLKSPASAQINMLNLLLKGHFGQLNPKQHEMLKLTCSSAKYMSNLVGNVLSEYKYESNSVVLNKSNFDLTELVSTVIEQNEILINEKGLNIIFNHNTEKCFIYADKLQIERVIVNLLSNAITYGFYGTDIIIDIVTAENNINFSISNKSNFIPKEELKNIFNKFSKSVNSKLNTSTTGLGLFSAKHIITMHGGKIYAQSTSDGICTFSFQLLRVAQNIEFASK